MSGDGPTKPRVCVIGAGPSGCSALITFGRLADEGLPTPEIVCYEKQSGWGGLWNYTWRTGLDEHGEPVHSSMYRFLWSNGSKEALEYPEYTFEDHFGKAIPSFPPREVLFDYLKGRWKKEGVAKYIKFSHVVTNVEYDEERGDFVVVVKDLAKDVRLEPQRFTHVIIASGHFSTPHAPSFPGLDRFPGRVLHAHDFRDAREFAGKKLLLVGASYSAEDIALQCAKYGAENVIVSWRTRPMGFKWPNSIQERPLLLRIEGRTAHFKDGTSADVDAVILCTGYLHHYPFLADNLRLKSRNRMWPPGLYKGVLFLGGGGGKLFYVGAQDQYYTFTMFEQCALWARNVIVGKIKLPAQDEMLADDAAWLEEEEKLNGEIDEIHFQTKHVKDLCEANCYPHNLDSAQIFIDWEGHKREDILTYRDKSFASLFTGTMSPVHHSSFMEAKDDSLQAFMNQTSSKSLD